MPTFLPLRTFGKTPLRVTPLCIGCAQMGSMPETFTYDVAEEQALETLRAEEATADQLAATLRQQVTEATSSAAAVQARLDGLIQRITETRTRRDRTAS